MKDNVVYEKAYDFAKQIVKCFQEITGEKKEFVLSKQLLRSGTSIGANPGPWNKLCTTYMS